MPRKVVLQDFGQFLGGLRGKKSLKKIELEAGANGISLPKSTLQTYEAGRVGSLSSNRLRELATVYEVAYETLLNEYVKDRFSADLLNPEYQITPRQQAIINGLSTVNGSYLLRLRWIFAEGQETYQRVIRDLLDEFSKEAPADALAPPEAVTDLTDPEALAGPRVSAEIHEFPGLRPVGVHRLSTAAGSGALDLDESIKTYAYFRHEWLSRHGLIADRCRIIGVIGESMEPTLPDGCVILLDRNRTRRREGQIFVVRTEDGLVVKRAGKDKKGNWQLLSDHPEWKPVSWPKDAVVIGEVKWSAVEL